MKSLDFSLILPCYNEGESFVASVEKILKALKKYKFEIIFVEDKSTDSTKLNVDALVKKIANARAIYHLKNLGRGSSVRDGILAARTNICGFMDVDCEISPTYVPLFVKEIKSGSDLVVGKRFYEKGLKSISRVVASRTYSMLVKKFLDLNIDDTETGYKFFNRKNILKVLKKVEDPGWFWDTEICARSQIDGLKIKQIPVLFIRRPEKKSTVRIFADSIDYFKKLIKFKKNI